MDKKAYVTNWYQSKNAVFTYYVKMAEQMFMVSDTIGLPRYWNKDNCCVLRKTPNIKRVDCIPAKCELIESSKVRREIIRSLAYYLMVDDNRRKSPNATNKYLA